MAVTRTGDHAFAFSLANFVLKYTSRRQSVSWPHLNHNNDQKDIDCVRRGDVSHPKSDWQSSHDL